VALTAAELRIYLSEERNYPRAIKIDGS